MEEGSSITWVFLLILNMALNAILWTISYSEVRSAHGKDEVEGLVNKALDLLDGCEERWPGTGTTSELYSIFSKACLQSYETRGYEPNMILTTPSSNSEPASSPEMSYSQAARDKQQQPLYLNPPQFGSVFGSSPESMDNFTLNQTFPPPQPTFRSNSIFQSPTATDNHGRRFSYFPPEFNQLDDPPAPDDPAAPGTMPNQHLASMPAERPLSHVSSPPDSLSTMSSTASSATLSPPHVPVSHAQGPPAMGVQAAAPTHQKLNHVQPQASQRIPPYGMPHQEPLPVTHQRPLPQQPPSAASTSGDWFSPAAAFMPPVGVGSMGGSVFYNDLSGLNSFGDFPGAGLGLDGLGAGAAGGGQQFDRGPLPGRQGSLTQTQQLELMNVLETEGVGDIDAFLKAGNDADAGWY